MKCLGLRLVICFVTLIIALVGGAAWASPIDPGFDLFHTPGGTAALPDFGFGLVPLMSRPIPGLGNVDTIVERKAGIDFSCLPSPGCLTIETEIVALSLQSVSPIELSTGSFFDVFVTINPLGLAGVLPTVPGLSRSMGTMTVRHEDPNGGTFDSFFDVFVEIDFAPHNTDQIVDSLRVLRGPDPLVGTNNPWSHTPPAGYPEIPDFPGGNFYPGPVHHEGPHPQVVPGTVPEPGSLILLVSGLALIAVAGRRKTA